MNLNYHRITGYGTLSQAVNAALLSGEENKPSIIAGFKGQRYYLFRGQANLGQQIYKGAQRKVALGYEITKKTV